MKVHQKILLFVLSISLFACNLATETPDSYVKTSEIIDSVQVTKNKVIEIDAIIESKTEKEQSNDCVRGQAEPVIQVADYPNTTFILQADSLTAIETVTYDNGDKLIIRNWGCEYYVLTFRFETSKFQQDTQNLIYWYNAAGILMTNMLSGLDAPIDIKRGIMSLYSYTFYDKNNNYKNVKLGEEIDFDDGGLRSFVTLDRIERLTDKKYALTISFATGPL